MDDRNLKNQENRSHLIDCFFVIFDTNNTARLEPSYKTTMLVAGIINLVFALFATIGNSFVLTAMWKVPSLWKPSNVLLCVMSLADFGVGLIVQPSLTTTMFAELERSIKATCIGRLMADTLGVYLTGMSGLTMTAMAVERFLFMRRRRSVLTMKRSCILVLVITLIPGPLVIFRFWFSRNIVYFYSILVVYGAVVLFCFFMTPYSYCRIFFIIRQHQTEVQANANSNSIDMVKYKKSITTLLWIVGLFLLSYIPYAVCILTIFLTNSWRSAHALGSLNFTAVWIFANSTLNPIVYCFRIPEIRNFVRSKLPVLLNRNRVMILQSESTREAGTAVEMLNCSAEN